MGRDGTMTTARCSPGGGDEAFIAAWGDELLPEVETLCARGDPRLGRLRRPRADPLAHLEVTEAGFGAVAEALGQRLTRLGLAGVALTLEGGYDLAALRASVAATVRGLLASVESA